MHVITIMKMFLDDLCLWGGCVYQLCFSIVFLINDLLGGEDRFGNKQNTIQQFIPEKMNWRKIGTTLMVRSCHAVAVVKITNDNYNQYCVQKE